MADTSPRLFNGVLHVRDNSVVSGKTLTEALTRPTADAVDRIGRGEGLFVAKLPLVTLQAGDRLYVRDTADRLKEYERLLGATLYDANDIENPVGENTPLKGEGQQLAEVVVSRGSPLHNRTLNAAHFNSLYNLVPLAIHRVRSGTDVSEGLDEIRLQAGDVLLVQGSTEAIAELRGRGSMLVLDGRIDLLQTDRAPWAIGILLTVVVVAAVGLLPMSRSALCGVGAMLLTRCLRWRETSRALSLPLILLVAAALSLGQSLTVTGAIDFIAALFVAASGGLPPAVILSGFMLILVLLTNVVTNNAMAVIGVPIAIRMAEQLGVPHGTFRKSARYSRRT